MSDITAIDISEAEKTIENFKELAEKRKLAMELYNNTAFRKLIVDDYFTQEAARMVQLSADPNMDAAQRADCLAMAQATGHFKRYLSATMQMGFVAERDLPEYESQLAEMRAEFANQE
jgi:hypothetical protein